MATGTGTLLFTDLVEARSSIRGLDGVNRQIEGIAFPMFGHDDRFLGEAGIFWEVK